MNILIIRLSSIGDIVHTLPAVVRLRQEYPGSSLTWVTGKTTSCLLESHPAITRVLTAEEKEWLRLLRSGRIRSACRGILRFLQMLRKEHYDMVLDFQGLLKSSLILACARGKRKIGLSGAREGSVLFYSEKAAPAPRSCHAIDRHMALLRHLGIAGPPGAPGPLFGTDDQHSTDELLNREKVAASRPIICMHLSARWPTKLWNPQHIAGLCEKLTRTVSCTILFIGDKAAAVQLPEPYRVSTPDIKNLTGKTSLRELACLMSRANLVLSTDSGPMHIACAVGTPVVALFGPTDQARTGPFGQNDTVISKAVPCRPCFSKKQCPEGHHRCMNDISVEEVCEVCCNYIR